MHKRLFQAKLIIWREFLQTNICYISQLFFHYFYKPPLQKIPHLWTFIAYKIKDWKRNLRHKALFFSSPGAQDQLSSFFLARNDVVVVRPPAPNFWESSVEMLLAPSFRIITTGGAVAKCHGSSEILAFFWKNVTQNQLRCESDFNCPKRLPNSYYKGIKPSSDISVHPGHVKNGINRKFFCARPAFINPVISLQPGLLNQQGPKHNNKSIFHFP